MTTFELDHQNLTLDGKPIRLVDVVALLSKLENKSDDVIIRESCKKMLDSITEKMG